MAHNTFEARQKLRAYLWRQKSKGPLNDPQAAALESLNEIDQLVDLLKRIERAGGLPDGLMLDIKAVLGRNRAV